MGCLLAIFAGFFPRFAMVVFWILRPDRVDIAYDTWIVPLLGVIFLPLTTLLYTVLWEPGGLEGWEWFWIGLAVILDLSHWGATATQRDEANRLRGGSPAV